MRELFKLDLKDYEDLKDYYIRPSARAIIIKNHKVALVYSKKFDYYKFPGGGIKTNEEIIDALIREVKEEVGLNVIKDTVKEYGKVLRIQRSDYNTIFYQENYYYLCDVDDEISNQKLDDYELEEGFSLVYVNPLEASCKNYSKKLDKMMQVMIERDALVLEMLVIEGII